MKNMIYADNIYLFVDMGEMVQIWNLLNVVRFIVGFIVCGIFASWVFGLRVTDFGIWKKRNSTYSVT